MDSTSTSEQRGSRTGGGSGGFIGNTTTRSGSGGSGGRGGEPNETVAEESIGGEEGELRDGERNVDQPAVLAPPHGLELLDALAAPQAAEDLPLLVAAIGWENEVDRTADRFLARIPEETLGGCVPAGDDAVCVDHENGKITNVLDCFAVDVFGSPVIDAAFVCGRHVVVPLDARSL